MSKITGLHIYYYDNDNLRHVKKRTPTDATNRLAIKHDIAEVIKSLEGKAVKYYVVFEFNSNGKMIYRTAIPTTFLK